MRLKSAHVTDFRNVTDSTEFSIGDVTCLVGKNESGKTTLLQALERLNSAVPGRNKFSKLHDYPRMHWADYDDRHPDDEAIVLQTTWVMDDADVKVLEKEFGTSALKGREFSVSKRYENAGKTWSLLVDEQKAANHLAHQAGVSQQFNDTIGLFEYLGNLSERTSEQEVIRKKIEGFRKNRANLHAIDLIDARMPKFLYFSNYSRMSGDVAINKLSKDLADKTVSEGDRLFLQFLEYAGTTLEELRDANQFEELRARIEAASNKITERVFEYWSQNQYLAIEVTVDQARSGDPAPYNDGIVVRARVRNTLHKATVPFSERSAGFVWFFSFLVAFAQVTKQYGNVIILLDEPGHGLHGKAQGDLLRYIDEKLRPKHQVIYSTHSPFMVPAEQLDRVRLVEDKLFFKDGSTRPTVLGTKVTGEFLSTDADTVFPLQAALGYELTQTLFVGKNCLLVEGPSDILYLQAASSALMKAGRQGLDKRWTICPSGGVDKVWPFVALFSGKKLNIAVLTDFSHGIKKNIEKLRSANFLKSGRVATAADFTGKPEADIEDLLGFKAWSSVVNGAYSLKGKNAIKESMFVSGADGSAPRVLSVTEDHFKLLSDIPEFDHFTPAEWLFGHQDILKDDSDALDNFERVFAHYNKML
ncbi:AAA family ATPase [Bradyrhizobium sp. LA6.12]|uniref:ATP-dependent nuclease n=1 Tax=unclassified Bradyrhizobium TaxID=2631580 RepID=UPI003393C64D